MTETLPTQVPTHSPTPEVTWQHRARLAGLVLVLCAVTMVAAWGLRGPSDALARSIAPTTSAIPGITSLAEIAVLLLGALTVVAGVRALRSGPTGIALAVSAALGVIAAYLSSEGLKSLVASDRVCRDLAGVGCPAVGDWGFPSNHTVVAVAGATAVLLLVRGWWPDWARWAVVALAVVAGAGRVLQGVHAPHEVVAGAALGASMVLMVTLLATDRLTTFFSTRSRPRPVRGRRSAVSSPRRGR